MAGKATARSLLNGLHRVPTGPGPKPLQVKSQPPPTSGLSSQEHLTQKAESSVSEQQKAWRGWCEIESDPAFFNHIIKQWGVRGGRISELWSLDAESLAVLPEPVHGIVFLFRYHDEDAATGSTTPAPAEAVWFARQLVRNSCASVALMNLIMNAQGLALGPLMTKWKDSTKGLTPLQRGKALAEFSFVRGVHNTWAREIDMLKQDLFLQDRHEAAKERREKLARAKAAASRRRGSLNDETYRVKAERTTAASRTRNDGDSDSEAGFHFIAYMPVADKVWRLDGMDKEPEAVEWYEAGDNKPNGTEWIGAVADVMQARMQQFAGEGVEFSIMAFAADPLEGLREEMKGRLADLRALERRLDQMDREWRVGLGRGGGDVDPETGLDGDCAEADLERYGISHADVAAAHCSTPARAALAPLRTPEASRLEPAHAHLTVPNSSGDSDAGTDADPATALLPYRKLRRDTLSALAGLRRSYADETERQRAEEEKARRRERDYMPAVGRWLRWLAEASEAATGEAEGGGTGEGGERGEVLGGNGIERAGDASVLEALIELEKG